MHKNYVHKVLYINSFLFCDKEHSIAVKIVFLLGKNFSKWFIKIIGLLGRNWEYTKTLVSNSNGSLLLL